VELAPLLVARLTGNIDWFQGIRASCKLEVMQAEMARQVTIAL
jgi:hypothetical protein